MGVGVVLPATQGASSAQPRHDHRARDHRQVSDEAASLPWHTADGKCSL